ncbi:MAG: hypothetical protein LBP21_04920 [Synergistaceae bacterium]|jgi:hypothetical protein|nr:hypothetical protein [Synergistaceae bacterium]
MIESFIEGRVRLRSPLFADEAFAERLKSELLAIDGVQKVEINPRTKGLLLEYDKHRLPLSRLTRVSSLFAQMNDHLPIEKRIPALEIFMKDLREALS